MKTENRGGSFSIDWHNPDGRPSVIYSETILCFLPSLYKRFWSGFGRTYGYVCSAPVLSKLAGYEKYQGVRSGILSDGGPSGFTPAAFHPAFDMHVDGIRPYFVVSPFSFTGIDDGYAP